MPELPEVETTLRGIEPFVTGRVLTAVNVREPRLRWPIPSNDLAHLVGQRVVESVRRAKYILLFFESGTAVLLHLGMSGSMRVLAPNTDPKKHDHLEFEFDHQHLVRLNDPRRFGCCLVLSPPAHAHRLLAGLGPEPLSDDFNADYLFRASRQKRTPIKNLIMDGHVVVGVGNIYASEALFCAGIRPTMRSARLSMKRSERLVDCIKSVLAKAIKAGGTTLNYFTQADGKPGYFRHELLVYARKGEGCVRCDTPIKSQVIGQRNTFYCPTCQHF